MANLKKVLRTCIICRNKFEQNGLIRLKCEDGKLLMYNNHGRSFYVCFTCKDFLQGEIKNKDYKRVEKTLNKECKSNNHYVTQLKEMLTNVR